MKVSEVVVTLNGGKASWRECKNVCISDLGTGAVSDLHLVIKDTLCMVNFKFTTKDTSQRLNWTYPMSQVLSIYHS